MANANLIRSPTGAFVKEREKDNERLKRGFAIFREALERNAQKADQHRVGPPKDWRTRVIK
jgi:hypothetical protein